MEGFGNYSFNQSHSMSYAVIALQTAYLKAHYPLEFYVAVLNACESDNSKINKKVTAAQKFGLEVLPPHINGSQAKFAPVDGKILFGLGAISGIGETVVDKIIITQSDIAAMIFKALCFERLKTNIFIITSDNEIYGFAKPFIPYPDCDFLIRKTIVYNLFISLRKNFV
jgi:DNA polymerase III alpha subunit